MTSVQTGSLPESSSSNVTSADTSIADQLPITGRNRVKRLPERGHYERDLINQILDEALICHVGFSLEGQPFVIPTAYGRVADRLYIHGSPASRMLRALKTQIEVCVTVTLLDGLVLARSAFHHSMNYRSVVIFGQAEVVNDADEKLAALQAFTNHIVPDRWSEVRPPTPQEMAGTLVLALSLQEASAKVRTGPPKDDQADYELPVWAGELPLRLLPLEPIPDPALTVTVPLPAAVEQYAQRWTAAEAE